MKEETERDGKEARRVSLSRKQTLILQEIPVRLEEKKRLVLIGIRKKGDRGFRFKGVDGMELSGKRSLSENSRRVGALL